jgi:drug/metabolite transporter (DMT)-like permease
MNRTAVLYALASAALFGASTPAAKALLGSINPVVLAGLLYCGAGIGIAILRRTAPALLASPQAREQALGRGDWPWLAGAIAAGGVLGPVLLMARHWHAVPSRAPRSWRGPARQRWEARSVRSQLLVPASHGVSTTI